MSRATSVISGCFVAFTIWAGYWSTLSAVPGAPAVQPASSATTPRLVINKYCVTCHNERLKTAGLALERIDADHVGEATETWEKVVRKLRAREMPPAGAPRPDRAAYEAAIASLEKALDEAAALNPNPGRVAVHRLNRSEYVNAARDLLALEIDAPSMLWADEPDQEGFENVASVLSMSPALLDGYIGAARKISRLAVGVGGEPVIENFEISRLLVQDERMSGDLPFGSQGGASIRYHFPLGGDYQIKVRLKRQLYGYILGMGEPHQIDVRLDGALVKRITIGGDATGRPMPESWVGDTQGDPEFEEYMHTADAGLEVRIPVTAGPHDIGVSFVRRFREPEGVMQPPIRTSGRSLNEFFHDYPGVELVTVSGPSGSNRPNNDTPSRRQVFVCRPKDESDEEPCAKRILSGLARRAFRRPITERDVETMMAFYQEGRATGSFDAGIERGLERILVAPSFLFRIEREPDGAVAGSVFRLSDIDLASRLSFFLWSSLPDDDLLSAAVAGKLSQPAELEKQVRRMLADRRATALVDNFVAQWLQLGKLASAAPDAEVYPEFDENLRHAMREETKEFVADQLRNDRSILEMITANYSYLNERLATHYGISDVYGSRLRKVTFTDGRRGGLLGQGSLLTVTSYPNRTSVVLRGKWLLAALLGAPPPAPPPDVKPLKEAGEDGQPRSLRKRMQEHRDNPVCATCHERMDPLGFSMENFDALGKWRTIADGESVDASASLPDGTEFDGMSGLRRMLLSQKDDYVRTFSAKLLGYAIGRGVEYYDQPAIRRIAREGAAAGSTWSSLILSVVRSTPFRMGRVAG
jgi:cytochrome c551/c552